MYENLYEAKEVCSSDNQCRWILDRQCDHQNFQLCSSSDRLEGLDSPDTRGCLYSKGKIEGK